MLRTLSIRDFVIVDAIELEFAPGFSVFTGETGAGKSILIDALALALGGRGDASVVREGAAKADITADFSAGSDVAAWLEAHEFSEEDGGVLLRRVIDNAGRSKAFINGIAATATQLRELGELLVDIHGQHAHQSLLKADAQRQLLDSQAGLLDEAKTVAAAYKTWRALAKQREEFEVNAKNVLLERERLEWQVSELEKLAVKPGEWSDISNEHSRLSHAASLIDGAQEALSAISESDSPILSQLSSLTQKLGKLTDVDAALKPVMDALEPAQIQLQEAVYALNDYLGRVELDPARLRQVDGRMEAIHSTARKFRVAPDDLPQEHAKLAEELKQLADASDLDALRAQEAKLQAAYTGAAQKLSKGRTKAAKALGEAVTAAMQDLSMSGGRFAIALEACEPAAYGVEQVEFLVAGHAGVAPRPLAKVASGGELARIALAISVIASSSTATPTLIFDEVDSGIGGGVAEVVGRLLKRLGQDRQVLCVTHLPQVASQGNQHFQVSKRNDAGKTVSQIEALDAKSRVEEIARMLGGLEITATTRKHARELLAL
ncbi:MULTISPECIES: DNA repair protein RecN [unclassified Herbaspirillum]|uniref:DNA repair protein RecN n=1 Tax=unclassified Herbaspirillum TaxID=2624150 RepID=UPI000E2FEFBA|nr:MULTISPECIES: DNA repair protein RecN [unclassified Herbaspirillum]RFB70729.1 DNA repair protein RecN [Herbaspirillum sp. 3R-3a1]TFI08750.1 DNA repair protein RecN [Herbaspirillum sp. 3R11]TFI15164.1 DNA repair protein RecN [Herbaspirillum sp. 3R-11]TFI31174.1 DNA repair protein RecN [Herbaspirillum sp. 3C11]